MVLDHRLWKPEDGCQQESNNPPSLHPTLHWKDIIAATLESGWGWLDTEGRGEHSKAKRDRPGGRLPFQVVKGRHLWPWLPGLINFLRPGHSLSSRTGPPEMGVGEEPLRVQ